MFSIIYRTVAFFIFTFLKITVAFTHNMHSMVLDICGIIGDTVRSNAIHELTSTQNIPQTDFTTQTDSDLNISVCTQTEERFTQSMFERHENNSSTDVFIYNLDRSKRVTITHKDLNSSFTKAKLNRCGNCKPEGKRLLRRIKSDGVNHRAVEKFKSNLSACSSRYKESESSNMSIENDVTNAEIMHYSHNATFTKDENIHDRLRQSSDDRHFEDDQENEYAFGVHECNEFEHFDENKPPVIIYEDDGRSISDNQKTSSPIEKLSQVSGVDSHTQLGNFPRNQQEGEFGDTENSDSSSDISDEFQTLRGDCTENKSFHNVLDNTVLLSDSVKRRLSLSSSFSTANEAANLIKIRNQIIEDTIKSTPRHEKTKKVIKYPFSPEMSRINRPDEEKENSKDMFSCSSQESLPVSDHIRNAFERSALYSLYKESFISASSPDFSSVDGFVEAFQKIKKALSVSEIVETPANFSFPEDSRNEVKRLLRAHSCCILGRQQSKTNQNNEMMHEDEQDKCTSNDDCSEIQRSGPAATNALESSRPELKCSISPSSSKVLSTASTSFDRNLDKHIAEQMKIAFDEIVENIDNYDKFKINEDFNGTDNMQSDLGCTSKDYNLGPSKINEYDFNSTQRDAEKLKLLTHKIEEDESFNSSRNQQRTESKTKPIVNKTKQTAIGAHCNAEKENAKENKNEVDCSKRQTAYARKTFTGSRNIETNRSRIKTELSKMNQSAKISKSKTPNDRLNIASKPSSGMLIIHPEMEENKPSQSEQLADAENDSVLTNLNHPSTPVERTPGREKFGSFKCGDEKRCDTQLENNVEQDLLETGQLETFVSENASCEDTSSDNSVLTVKDLEDADERS